MFGFFFSFEKRNLKKSDHCSHLVGCVPISARLVLFFLIFSATKNISQSRAENHFSQVILMVNWGKGNCKKIYKNYAHRQVKMWSMIIYDKIWWVLILLDFSTSPFTWFNSHWNCPVRVRKGLGLVRRIVRSSIYMGFLFLLLLLKSQNMQFLWCPLEAPSMSQSL